MKKRIFLFALLLSVLAPAAIAQQGKWSGTVKYQLTWTGNIPAEAHRPTEWETKVFENKTKSQSLCTLISHAGRCESWTENRGEKKIGMKGNT